MQDAGLLAESDAEVFSDTDGGGGTDGTDDAQTSKTQSSKKPPRKKVAPQDGKGFTNSKTASLAAFFKEDRKRELKTEKKERKDRKLMMSVCLLLQSQLVQVVM